MGGKIASFKTAPPAWDAGTADDPEAIRQSLVDYLVNSSVEYFENRDTARVSVSIFEEIYLNKISKRALKTVYAGLAGGVVPTIEYLKAIEILLDETPLRPDHCASTIYFKRCGDEEPHVVEKVASVSNRVEIVTWPRRRTTKGRPPPPPNFSTFLGRCRAFR